MSKLPIISGRDCIKALMKIGFQQKRQKGSHISIVRKDPYAQVVVPDHKELDRGTLHSIIRQVGLSTEEFIDLLK
jgi:predicted RNA binding protein YcfA (HicA-like mRNA interferase family)